VGSGEGVEGGSDPQLREWPSPTFETVLFLGHKGYMLVPRMRYRKDGNDNVGRSIVRKVSINPLVSPLHRSAMSTVDFTHSRMTGLSIFYPDCSRWAIDGLRYCAAVFCIGWLTETRLARVCLMALRHIHKAISWVWQNPNNYYLTVAALRQSWHNSNVHLYDEESTWNETVEVSNDIEKVYM
jgi:hypothetical protein